MVSRISDKWSLWTMGVIAEHGRPMRFSRIMDQVEGISQKSLTKTLRGLERDGLITREVFAEVPPRVEYTITAFGSEMPFRSWDSPGKNNDYNRHFSFQGRETLVFDEVLFVFFLVLSAFLDCRPSGSIA